MLNKLIIYVVKAIPGIYFEISSGEGGAVIPFSCKRGDKLIIFTVNNA